MKFCRFWLPVFLWAGLIFYFSSMPQLIIIGGGIWDLIAKKLAHISEYFILTLLLYRAFKGSFSLVSFYPDVPTESSGVGIPSQKEPPDVTSGEGLHLIFWPAMLSFFYAVSDEIHQFFVPTRNASPVDVLIDSLGIIAFYAFIKIKKR